MLAITGKVLLIAFTGLRPEQRALLVHYIYVNGRNLIVFLNDRASLPHGPLRREISAFGAWKKSSDDVK